MQDLKVTLVQANQVWEDKTANFTNYLRLLETVDETDLIVLPEMFNTGFTMNAQLFAEDAGHSTSIKWLQELALKKNAAIYTSLIIKENSEYFNRGVFVEPSGEIHQYDKRKLFGLAGEDLHFSFGTITTIVTYKQWKINLQICYDLRFPEVSMNYYENEVPKYDLSIYVANWPEKRINHWNALLVARGIENQSYVIGVNRVGNDGKNISYSGGSQSVNPLGESQMLENHEHCKTLVLSTDFLHTTRVNLPFLKDKI